MTTEDNEGDIWVIELFDPPDLWGYWTSELGASINKDILCKEQPQRKPVVRKVRGKPVAQDPQPLYCWADYTG